MSSHTFGSCSQVSVIRNTVNPQASLSIKGETFMYQLLVSPTAVGAVFQVLPITIFAGLIYILIHILTQRKGTEHTGLYFTIVNGLLVCYVVALVSLLLSPRNFWVYIWFYVFNGYTNFNCYEYVVIIQFLKLCVKYDLYNAVISTK